MNTINYTYKNDKDLSNFLDNFDKEKEFLIQIFSGNLDKSFLQNLTNTILAKLPNAKIIGATTDGEIYEDNVLTNSVIISITQFNNTTISISKVEFNDISDSFEAGEKIASNLLRTNSKVFILFGDGLKLNGEDFLKGVEKVTNGDVIISGGLAGDNATFANTYTIYQNDILEAGVVGVSLNNKDLKVSNSYSFAWKDIGREFTVEKSIKNRVYLIDGKTPLELYKEYLGEEIADNLPGTGIEFPLIITNKNIKVARAVLSKEDDGSLIFAGNIDEGSRVKFGIGDANIILNNSSKLAISLENTPVESIFIYSCMARRRFLETNANIDTKFFSQIANVSGFFTYGEFFTQERRCNLLNETLTILGLSETDEVVNKKIDTNISFSNTSTLRALANLANKASKEYEELNRNLEKKVQEEVEKNLKAKQQLMESMKLSMLGEMIGNIAHQWRQPLSVITTGASGLKLNKELGMLDDTQLEQYLDMAIEQAMYLSETIDIFRNFIKEKHELKDVSIEQEIKKAIQISKVALKDNKIKLIDNIDYKQNTIVKIITGELPQVIINILNNAKDVINERKISDRWVKIDLLKNEKNITISIEDSAGGIPDDIIDKIFEPYFTTKSDDKGTGIGLYMSYEIIKDHFNGDIKISNSKNGAKFDIIIPT